MTTLGALKKWIADRADRKAVRSDLVDMMLEIAVRGEHTLGEEDAVRTLASGAGLNKFALQKESRRLYRLLVNKSLSGGTFGWTELNESRAILTLVGLEPPDLHEAYRGEEQIRAFLWACTKSGDLPTNPAPQIRLRRNERAHIQVAETQLIGNDRTYEFSFSAPLGVGISMGMPIINFQQGDFKGTIKPGSFEQNAEDEGDLWLTSERVLFLGVRRTLSLELSNTLRIDASKGVIRLHVEGSEPSLFSIGSMAEVITAAIIVALRSLDESASTNRLEIREFWE